VAVAFGFFKVSMAVVKGIVMQADKDGLNLHRFEVGEIFQLTHLSTAELAPSAGTLSLFKIQRQDDS
jgi:hypothetical protein